MKKKSRGICRVVHYLVQIKLIESPFAIITDDALLVEPGKADDIRHATSFLEQVQSVLRIYFLIIMA